MNINEYESMLVSTINNLVVKIIENNLYPNITATGHVGAQISDYLEYFYLISQIKVYTKLVTESNLPQYSSLNNNLYKSLILFIVSLTIKLFILLKNKISLIN